LIEKVIEGRAFVKGRFSECCIGIEQGRIAKVGKVVTGERRVKLKGLILPAAIDVHVHFRDPGFPEKEDFSSGTISAAFGGVSYIIDMPNTVPPTTTAALCREKIGIGERKAYIDFGIHAEINENNVEDLSSLVKHCTAFKVYLEKIADSVINRIPELEKVVAFHAEDKECLNRYKDGATNLLEHAKARPSVCEERAVKKILKCSASRVHICHISSIAALHVLSRKQVTVGVTPHHLLFKASKDLKPQTLYKVNPPLRSGLDQEALWDSISSIDVIESDHAPHTLDEKEQDFSVAPSGMPGTETMFPIMLYQFIRRGLSINRLISLVCERPAEIFTLPKGKIEVGRDADFMVVEPKNVEKIKGENLHSRCGWTAFEGFPAIFPKELFVRGERVIEDGELVGERGFGRFIGGEKDEVSS
jgi:dihydroorotase